MNKKRNNTNITNFPNDYTQEKNLQSHREKKSKRNARRRISVLFIVSVLLIGGLVFKIALNQKEIASMNVKEVHAEQDLKKTQADQRILNNQIKQLKDESYIEKLARGQYDLSKEGELIFNFADDSASKKLEEAKKKLDDTQNTSSDKKDSSQESSSE
ncbi:FtsB family cell division protein [Carnobacterium gallinarum]|uniref:FtsB family cell division protein n=1 Tax=Carnobacterium gallinarum TaxID=2749 RepID=UPI00054E4DE1|nr:septum formation initiator family protein [Carnobacterium gallinarum]